jgi:hypothetical protein
MQAIGKQNVLQNEEIPKALNLLRSCAITIVVFGNNTNLDFHLTNLIKKLPLDFRRAYN